MFAQIPPEISALLTQKTLLFATAGWVLLQNLGRMYWAVRNGGGLVTIWRGLLYGANAPASTNASSNAAPGAARGIVPLLLSAFLLSGLCAGVSLVGGCGTTPQKASYASAGATAITVDAAMTVWGDYVHQFHPPASQEAKVKAAYEHYQNAMLVLIDSNQLYVILAGSGSTNAPPAQAKAIQAQQQAAQALADLVALLRSFGVKI